MAKKAALKARGCESHRYRDSGATMLHAGCAKDPSAFLERAAGPANGVEIPGSALRKVMRTCVNQQERALLVALHQSDWSFSVAARATGRKERAVRKLARKVVAASGHSLPGVKGWGPPPPPSVTKEVDLIVARVGAKLGLQPLAKHSI